MRKRCCARQGRSTRAALAPVERIDKRLAEGFLRIQQWEFGSDHFQRGNPALYTGEAIFGVIGLFLTDYAPFAERAEAACARMHAIEGLLAQGRDKRAAGAGGVDAAGAARVRGRQGIFRGGDRQPRRRAAHGGSGAEGGAAAGGRCGAGGVCAPRTLPEGRAERGADRGAGLRPRGAGSAAARGALPARRRRTRSWPMRWRRWRRPRRTWRRTPLTLAPPTGARRWAGWRRSIPRWRDISAAMGSCGRAAGSWCGQRSWSPGPTFRSSMCRSRAGRGRRRRTSTSCSTGRRPRSTGRRCTATW